MAGTSELAPWFNERQRKLKKGTQHHMRQGLRYGFGILAGIALVDFAKATVRRIPLFGRVVSPFLSLVPSVIVGGACGAALVYGMDEVKGDVRKVKTKLLPDVKRKARRARREASNVVRGLKADLAALQRQQNETLQQLQRSGEEAARRIQPVLEDTVDGVHRRVMPVLEREHYKLQKQWAGLQQSFRDHRAEQQHPS